MLVVGHELEVSYRLVKCMAANICGGDHEACATSGHIPESQWGLHAKINVCCTLQ
jgi:hypothetical protein